MNTLRVVERIRLFTPLGIRFWDAALEVPVTTDLVVHAWRRGMAPPGMRAHRSPSGIYSFHGLPGLAATEHPVADDPHPEISPDPVEFTISVSDPRGAFLPAAFTVELPLGYRGEFLAGSAESPPGAPGRAYLFSASTRMVAASMAAVRAQLLDADTGLPATWAVLTAVVEDRTLLAIADAAGRLLLPVPVPTVDRLRLGSPPGTGQGSPLQQEWSVDLSVRYEPTALRFPLLESGQAGGFDRVPSLKSVLDEQRAGLIVAAAGEAPVSSLTRSLNYGEELVLRSVAGDGAAASTLWIHPAASSPP